MGRLTYDSTLTVDFEDRLLVHLQMVIGAKFRRNESFYFSWRDDPDIGDGRSTLWLHPTMPLYFKYSGGRPPSINRHWIDELMLTANSPGGLQIVAEPTVPASE
ncbi:MAG TPA: ATP-dependent DNA ligase [Lacisediminihabitans sp.]|nr:ATP-dependent DNA ligase [Lacisediminihabitans sp.]HXD61213.1 ATP-dependent DNA ligase [Lacisediminihabitans sp.]